VTARKTTTPRKPGQILAYLDPEVENKTLLEVLIRLAQRDGAEVLALCVLRDLPWYAKVDGRVRDALEHQARDALAKSAGVLEKAAVKVRTQVRWGRPFEVIIQEVARARPSSPRGLCPRPTCRGRRSRPSAGSAPGERGETCGARGRDPSGPLESMTGTSPTSPRSRHRR